MNIGTRTPLAVAPERIAALANLPLFHKLTGRRVVMAGGGDALIWKIELLAAAGADVAVFATRRDDRVAEIAASAAQRPGFGRIALVAREPDPADFAGAALAVGGFDTALRAEAFASLARAAGVPVNVIDKPAFCDFSFGAIVNRSPLVVGISTDGAAPVLGQAIRTRIEGVLPRRLKAWAEAAQAWRPEVQSRIERFTARRAFWRRFTAHALDNGHRAPDEADRAALFADHDAAGEAETLGRVFLVGAGPGDPELLTLKAVRILQGADVILFDDLVTPEVLDLARREAERVRVGKRGHGPSCAQEDINDLIVTLAQSGKRVVRLKGGDPLIFGRATEEIDACREAGVPVEIVPGVTAAQGAAAALGVSLTERRLARRVQFVTGHDAAGRLPTDINWAAVADPSVTTVIYMPRATLGAFRDRAVAAGLSPETPAAAVRAATRPGQQAVGGTIASLCDQVAALDEGPVVVLIGEALRSAATAASAMTLARRAAFA